MLVARTTALAGIYALIRDNPAALTPELAAKIDEIAAEGARALSKHHNDTASDFTRCPTCGHRPEDTE